MSRPFDASLKSLVADHPEDWLAFLGRPGKKFAVIDTDLSTVSAAADKVIRVKEGKRVKDWLFHIEFQSGPRSKLAEQLNWYNVLLRHRHGLRVRTVVVLLHPRAESKRLTGVYQDQFPGEEPYNIFRYQVIRVWKRPVEEFLNGGQGLMPLAFLTVNQEKDLPVVFRRIAERLPGEGSGEEFKDFWAASYILVGLRFSRLVAQQLFQGVRNMRESVTFQAILEEGKEKGREEGLKKGLKKGRKKGREEGLKKGQEKGALLEARKTILLLGTEKLGPPSSSDEEFLEDIDNLEHLERLIKRLLTVTSWEDLLATP